MWELSYQCMRMRTSEDPSILEKFQRASSKAVMIGSPELQQALYEWTIDRGSDDKYHELMNLLKEEYVNFVEHIKDIYSMQPEAATSDEEEQAAYIWGA